jgi:hydrogenase nickel incorporation protein HypB
MSAGSASNANCATKFLFIENVGNLVCLASYDLGESLRVVLLSVTEGEDKPLKYPTLFHSADVAVITKCDLSGTVGFDRDAALTNLTRVAPAIRVFETSARTADGVGEWLQFLTTAAHATSQARNVHSSAPLV